MAAEAKKKEDGVRESDDKFCEPKLLLPQIARIETKTYQPSKLSVVIMYLSWRDTKLINHIKLSLT